MRAIHLSPRAPIAPSARSRIDAAPSHPGTALDALDGEELISLLAESVPAPATDFFAMYNRWQHNYGAKGKRDWDMGVVERYYNELQASLDPSERY